jgi:hypothetical protein
VAGGGVNGAEGIRAGDRVVIDGRPRVVLGASGTAIRFAGDDGVVEEAAAAELAGSGRLRQPRPAGRRPGPQIGLAGLPPEMVERARWEDHIIEVVDGTRPDAPAGTPPRPEYDAGPAPAIGPIQKVLDKLADEPLTIWEIWTTVTDEHDSGASDAAIRDYIRSRRLAGQS